MLLDAAQLGQPAQPTLSMPSQSDLAWLAHAGRRQPKTLAKKNDKLNATTNICTLEYLEYLDYTCTRSN